MTRDGRSTCVDPVSLSREAARCYDAGQFMAAALLYRDLLSRIEADWSAADVDCIRDVMEDAEVRAGLRRPSWPGIVIRTDR